MACVQDRDLFSDGLEHKLVKVQRKYSYFTTDDVI